VCPAGAEDAELRRWLIDLPAAKEMTFSIRMGEEASLTPETQGLGGQVLDFLDVAERRGVSGPIAFVQLERRMETR
jgi:hypothetical protein